MPRFPKARARVAYHRAKWRDAKPGTAARTHSYRMLKARKADLARLLKPRPVPLRLSAWAEMRKLIDAKVTEEGGNNRGREVEAIIRANGGVPGEPWCGDTVAYVYLKAGAKSVVRAWAAVRFLERLLTKVIRPKRGHVVIYSFSHTGLFDRWAPELGPGMFYAGEGNTGDSGAVSDSRTGADGVKRKARHVSQVSSFRRVLR